MFPAPNQAESSEEQEEVNSEQAEPVACRGWRWLLSWLVGSSLASSPTLPLFLMVMLGDFLATMSLTIPYTFLPAMAVAQGISAQDAAFLISAAGISSTVRTCLILDHVFSDFLNLSFYLSDPSIPHSGLHLAKMQIKYMPALIKQKDVHTRRQLFSCRSGE